MRRVPLGLGWLAATQLVVRVLGQVTGGLAVAQRDHAVRAGTIQGGVGAVENLIAGIRGDVDGMPALPVRQGSPIGGSFLVRVHFGLRKAKAGGGVGHHGAVRVLGARLAGLHGQLGAVGDAGVALEAIVVATGTGGSGTQVPCLDLADHREFPLIPLSLACTSSSLVVTSSASSFCS